MAEIPEEVKQEVWRLHNGECIYWHNAPFREGLEYTHMEEHRGMGGDASKNTVMHIGLGCKQCHKRFHSRGAYKIVHFDPYDKENGLIIVSHRGKEVPKHHLWFYNRQACERLGKEQERIEKLVSESHRAIWEVANYLEEVDTRGSAKALGYENIYELGAQFQLSSSKVKQLVKLWRFMQEYDLEPGDTPIELAQVLKRADKKGKLEDAVAMVEGVRTGEVHIAEFWDWVDQELKEERVRKAWVGKGKLKKIELSEDVLFQKDPDEFVLKGGSLVAGVGLEEEE